MTPTLRMALRVTAAMLLGFALSGAPNAINTALGVEDTCAEDCDGTMGDQDCPPTCTQGACAKVFATMLGGALPQLRPKPWRQPRARFAVAEPVADPRLSPARMRVFHPPKA